MISITISGFRSKEEAIQWLKEYEGGLEQHFEINDPDTDGDFYATCNMNSYIPELKKFREDAVKTNFNLELT